MSLIKLSDDQAKGLVTLHDFVHSSENFLLLSGYAGCGKTFLIAEFIKQLYKNGINCLCVSPTHKATQALREHVDTDVITLAKALEKFPVVNDRTGDLMFLAGRSIQVDPDSGALMTPSGKHLDDEDYLLWKENAIVIVDECSMVSTRDYNNIKVLVDKHNTKVVFVGDVAQLPPVRENVSPVPSDSSINCHIKLTQVIRYEGDILKAATDLRDGSLINYTNYSDSGDLITTDRFKGMKMAFEDFKTKTNAKILAYTNDQVQYYNHKMRQLILGVERSKHNFLNGEILVAQSPIFAIDESEPCIRNSEEMTIIDGDSVYEESQLKRYEMFSLKEKMDLSVNVYYFTVETNDGLRFKLRTLDEDGFIVLKEYTDFLESLFNESLGISFGQAIHSLRTYYAPVRYNYACTVHKAQGSTINNVYVDLDNILRSRNRASLEYTALTRARKKAIVMSRNFSHV